MLSERILKPLLPNEDTKGQYSNGTHFQVISQRSLLQVVRKHVDMGIVTRTIHSFLVFNRMCKFQMQ